MTLQLDLAELSKHLRQERLFVTSEREQLQNLHDQVKISSEQLYHQSWISRQLKDLLDSLNRSDHHVKPADCFCLANQLEAANFVDGYKHLSYHDTNYGEFLKFLSENPSLLGHVLCTAEANNVANVQEIIIILMHSLFGNCVLQEDETRMLHVLKSLLDIQLTPCDDPRRLLRHGSCAFSLAFKQLFDTLFSSKVFLMAALHDPVMRLLMEDEWFYDIDPGKALVRFPASERFRRFGEPGTSQYKEKLAKYRSSTVDKLVIMANRFISSIKNNMHCFPSSLGWIVSQVYQTLTKSGKVEMSEVRAVCTDLVFAFFICPAICDPEPHGITTDVPISHIARHNLIQMAQIIHVLALSQSEEINPKLHDLYGRFEKGCMSTLLDSLLDVIGIELPSVNLNKLLCLTRNSCLIQLSQLNSLISFLRASLPFVEDSAQKKVLDEILSNLAPLSSQIPAQSPVGCMVSSPSTPPRTPTTQRKTKVKKRTVVSMVSQLSMVSDESNSVSTVSMETEAQPTNMVEEVLVISLGNDLYCPGMISEQRVLSFDQENKRRRVKYQTVPGRFEVEIQEKRTRFSLSHDQESIGNTSDIQEAISEGASSHSVGSQDLENDDDNDNFSDMISANVSGRGTPNISESGRDTPLSQAESEEVERVPIPPPVLPETILKKNREDVTDKFGKFEIKPELDYDLKSTVSDTWSTDVLASDSEPPDTNQQVRLEEISEEIVTQHLLATQERVIEMSETASDAWSTDVLASDNEEKQETEAFSELDDVSSMAEISSNLDEVRSETDIAEGNEITPLASGLQISNESGSADMFPVTDRSCGGTSINSDNVSTSPTFSDSAYSDSDFDRVSRGPRSAQSANNMDSNRLFVPINRKRDQTSPPSISPDRASNIARPPSIRNRLVDFDLEPRPGNLVTDSNKPGSDSDFSNSDSLISTINDTITIDTSARPKGKWNDSSKADIKYMKNVSSLKYKENDIKIAKADLEETPRQASGDNGRNCVQFIEINDVKSTEPQNHNVNAEKFSAALNLFDPLVDDNETRSSELLDRTGNSPLSHSFYNFDYQEDNSKPLVNIGDRQNSNQFEFGVSSSRVIQNGVCEDARDVFIEDEQELIQRRGSTDSNTSSESSLSKDGSGDQSQRPSNNEVTSERSEEKEIPVGEETVPSGKKRGGLFKTFKEKIHQGIKKKGSKLEKDKYLPPAEKTMVDVSVTETKGGVICEPSIHLTETSDDILAKYRKKSILTSTLTTEPVPSERDRHITLKEADNQIPVYDPSNLENCLAFLDAKKKLRIVLSSADFQVGYSLFGLSTALDSHHELDINSEKNSLINLLRTQLSEAINLQNNDTVAQLHEALRCVRQFDNEGCKNLVRCLQEDYSNRTSYISYLVRCKHGLLNTLSHVNRLQNRIKREKEIYDKHMTNVVVRMFLETWERPLLAFIAEFQRLTVSDEKTDHVERFLQFLYQTMNKDPIWQVASESQVGDSRLAIDRYIMSRIYTQAMFPNGDGDIHRDQLFQQHLKELSKTITPDHKDVKIHKMYHLECPWPAAQRELYMINAYKTPKDKVRCILRCTSTIMNLLCMANEKSVPAADDFTPVFIFVIIKANPPCILSTIQYVNSFYGARLQGEEHYWWTQFVGAIEFIKTMDYLRESAA